MIADIPIAKTEKPKKTPTECMKCENLNFTLMTKYLNKV